MMGFEELLLRLRADYPELKFRVGAKFMYRPPRAVYYEQFMKSESGTVHQSVNAGAESEQKKYPSQEALGLEGADEAKLAEIEQKYCLQLLHEVGHAVLEHFSFDTDLERIKIERSAWDKARQLCDIYNIPYDEDFVEDELDTYREWLHRRSVCRKCGIVRYQDRRGVYHCPGCEALGA